MSEEELIKRVEAIAANYKSDIFMLLYTAITVGYQRGVKDTITFLQENDAMDCSYCPCENNCNDDCWKVIAEHLKEK